VNALRGCSTKKDDYYFKNFFAVNLLHQTFFNIHMLKTLTQPLLKADYYATHKPTVLKHHVMTIYSSSLPCDCL